MGSSGMSAHLLQPVLHRALVLVVQLAWGGGVAARLRSASALDLI